MPKIADLPAMPNLAVYRRPNGETWGKLNAGYHVKVKLGEDGSVVGDGVAERLDPAEEVVVLNDCEHSA